jgi:hypothetical protein
MGGYNRSPFPGGNLIKKRTIYYIQNLSSEHKNKPNYEIAIPKNEKPISILELQYPFLMCYCEPSTYIIHIIHQTILISFQK